MPEVQAEEGYTLWHGIHRILLKLARESDILPPSLFITGLHIPRIDRAVCLGGFADIYLGSFKGEAVAVKRLRVTDEQISMNPVSPIRYTQLNRALTDMSLDDMERSPDMETVESSLRPQVHWCRSRDFQPTYMYGFPMAPTWECYQLHEEGGA
jgi:hypothetical protein